MIEGGRKGGRIKARRLVKRGKKKAYRDRGWLVSEEGKREGGMSSYTHK